MAGRYEERLLQHVADAVSEPVVMASEGSGEWTLMQAFASRPRNPTSRRGSERLRVYIAGLISKGGTLPEDEQRLNIERFAIEAERLRRLGYEPVNPVELHPEIQAAAGRTVWQQALRLDLATLVTCDAIVKLDGWEGSSGACLEVHVARALGLVELEAAKS